VAPDEVAKGHYGNTNVAAARIRLPTSALNAEAAQRAFKLRNICADALEVLTGKREKLHRRARHDRGRPLSGQEERDLAERVARTESLGLLAPVGQDLGLSLLDEVDGGPVVVERDDLGTRLNLDLAHRGRKRTELRFGETGQDRE
jgi:hypothetical protein